MNVVLPKPGAYIIAVSGGVDSRALLDILYKDSQNNSNWKLIVAHLDHGMRSDSADDRKFVQAITKQYDLLFEYHTIALGVGASEARARAERYTYLNRLQKKYDAQAVITAHHQDDVLETAIINLLRGSGRKGLSALSSQPKLLRPLLGVTKQELLDYAGQHGLNWREDSTNQDDSYLRNYVRHNILPRFDIQARRQFLEIIQNMKALNTSLDDLLNEQLQLQDNTGTITRTWFNNLPHAVAKETLASWLRLHKLANFDAQTLERLVVNAKAARTGQQFPVVNNYTMKVNKNYLALEPAER